ncbi:DUF4468 domain-containing protein [Mucilaginibacter sp. FT3.2]|uniref:DUF4468 domain-containing protein n=1 Tax=Mucilaginibacter sp. FT3.2 TaxID=2723090 RepID=UPI001610E30D|nr:DUF4468 domain-containing protein [Mucilaginibacter sp. FT3.2]MBB6232988.1 hypothetical protein [Mucilaginibacter sp. FT3.2]
MKKILLITLVTVIWTSVQAQYVPPIDSVTKKITFQEVVNIDKPKSYLYDKALNWMASSFNSSNDVIQIKDKDAGKIVGKYHIKPYDDKFGYVSATITLLFKDGKYKYIITDIFYDGSVVFSSWPLEDDPKPGKVSMTKWGQKTVKNNTYAQIQSLIGRLKTYMVSKNEQDNF